LWKAARADGGVGRAPQSAKVLLGVFFLIAFSFAPAYAKEKADEDLVFYFATGCT
jgi:predicted transporter